MQTILRGVLLAILGPIRTAQIRHFATPANLVHTRMRAMEHLATPACLVHTRMRAMEHLATPASLVHTRMRALEHLATHACLVHTRMRPVQVCAGHVIRDIHRARARVHHVIPVSLESIRILAMRWSVKNALRISTVR